MRIDLTIDPLLKRFNALFCNVFMGDEVLHLRLNDAAGFQVVGELPEELAIQHVSQVDFMTVLVGDR